MNNDLEQFSEERLKEIVSAIKLEPCDYHDAYDNIPHGEIAALARIALSAKQAKPAAWTLNDSPIGLNPVVTLSKSVAKSWSDKGRSITQLFATPQPAHTWIKCSESMPEPEIPVLIMNNGDMRIGEIRWDYPTHEETYQAFRYWDDPFDDGQIWDYCDITHWMPLPATPKPEPK